MSVAARKLWPPWNWSHTQIQWTSWSNGSAVNLMSDIFRQHSLCKRPSGPARYREESSALRLKCCFKMSPGLDSYSCLFIFPRNHNETESFPVHHFQSFSAFKVIKVINLSTMFMLIEQVNTYVFYFWLPDEFPSIHYLTTQGEDRD